MTSDAIAYQLRTPATWRSIDLTVLGGVGDGGLDRAVAAVGLGGRCGPGPDDGHRLVREAVRAARSGGGIELYVFQAMPDGRAITSTLVTSAWPAGTEQDHGDIDFLALRMRLAAGAEGETGRDVSVVRLPGVGDAVRIERRRSVAGEWPGAGEPRHHLVSSELHYLVPVPHTQAVLGLTFATPNISLAPAFARLWEAVAGTLRFVDTALVTAAVRNYSPSRPRAPDST